MPATKIVYLLPDLQYSSATQQVRAVVLAGVVAGPECAVASLGGDGPAAAWFRELGVSVSLLSPTPELPVASAVRLETLLREFQPGTVHVWHLPSLRTYTAARLFKTGTGPRLIVSEPFRGARWTPLDRWLIGKAAAVTTSDVGQTARYHAERLDARRHREIPLAVVPPGPVASPLDMPADARMVIGVGRLTPEHGFRDALWALDVLKFVYPKLYFVLIGDGPERERLQRFSRQIGGDDHRARFVPERADAVALLPTAEVAWVPSRKPCGFQVALDAMAAGVPVVAVGQPGMAELLGDAGLIAPVGDPVEFAKISRRLLDDPDLRQSCGDAGRARVEANHSINAVAELWRAVYDC